MIHSAFVYVCAALLTVNIVVHSSCLRSPRSLHSCLCSGKDSGLRISLMRSEGFWSGQYFIRSIFELPTLGGRL